MVKVIRFPFQSNIYVSKKKKKWNLTNFIQKKEKKNGKMTGENPIRFQIRIQLESNFAPHVPFNLSFLFFVQSELIQCKNWISIGV